MSENRNCLTGRDLVQGDEFTFEAGTTIKIHGFLKQDDVIDGAVPDFRMASVTIGPGSILREWPVHDKLFYQICDR